MNVAQRCAGPVFELVVPANPQSWSRYAYALNNPLEYVDPDGLCPTGSHDATAAEMAAAIKIAEGYARLAHCAGAHFGPGSIDCSGLIMNSLSGIPRNAPPAASYLGMNLTTRNIGQWSDPGTGAVGDIIFFAKPGHVGIVTAPGRFFGAQDSGVAEANFGPHAPYWGSRDTSAPEFRRACVADASTTAASPAGTSGDGHGRAGIWGASGPVGGDPFGPLGLGDVTGNWENVIGMYIGALMPAAAALSVGQAIVIGITYTVCATRGCK